MESTKTLPVMEGLAAGNLGSAEPERGTQERECLGFALLVYRFIGHQLPKFFGKHATDTGSALGGEGACLLQQLLVERKRDVLFHSSKFTRKIREPGRRGCAGEI